MAHEHRVPQQKTPVRYARGARYSSVGEFCELILDRLLAELGAVAALEVFSTLYALVAPWDALGHDSVSAVLAEKCAPRRRNVRWQTFRARGEKN